MQKLIGLVLLVAAFAMLLPGLTHPMLSVSGTVEKEKLVDVGKDLLKDSPDVPRLVSDLAERVIDGLDVTGTVPAFDKTNSILGTAEDLYRSNHKPVAALIILFSVIIPLFKILLLLSAMLPMRSAFRQRLLIITSAMSKWSMADVFVVAIFVAYMAANGIQESRELVDFDAGLGTGFYYFTAYCLVSILGTQVLVHALRKSIRAAADA